uniref:Large ribosomal subunit protein uL23c n=1 Tax=Cryptomonas sp. SAG 977-2f TaxID=279061 RepID=A0A679CB55_9CRYP|nr:ribosomal protein L23 [Cryptomonas sp. SAG 977-2f]
MDISAVIDLIKYPIITDKATKLLELNQYSFATDIKAHKNAIKTAIEYLFKVKVVSVNTHTLPYKHRRIGKVMGNRSHYKKAIVTVAPGNSINLFSEN